MRLTATESEDSTRAVPKPKGGRVDSDMLFKKKGWPYFYFFIWIIWFIFTYAKKISN